MVEGVTMAETIETMVSDFERTMKVREPRKEDLIQGQTGDWEIILGLEVHAQVSSNAKLFSAASTRFGAEQNSQVSFVDAAMPGMLPVINRFCVEQAVRTGLGLKAQINLRSVFDRKNYFYPDLPQGYQISQFKHPIVGEGEVILDMPDGRTVNVGIERLHLEQDAGKSLHDQHPAMSFVDLNRSGVALMEMFRSRTCARPMKRGLMLRSCARSCVISALATGTWKRVPCARMLTFRCGKSARALAHAAKSRM